MKKFILFLFLLSHLANAAGPVFPGPSGSLQTITSRGLLVGNRLQEDDNFIINPSAFLYPIAPFTNSTNNGVTASVSATVSRSTTTPLSLSNVAEFNITFGAINQSVSWLTKPLSSGLKGRQCEANWTYRGFQSSTRFQIRFNGVTRYQVAATVSATDAVPGSIPFPCGDLTETITFVVADTGFLSGTNEISDIEIGAVKSFGDAANITAWQSYTPTYAGFTVGLNSTEWRRNGDTLFLRGRFTTASTSAVVAAISFPTNSGLSSNPGALTVNSGRWWRNTAGTNTIKAGPILIADGVNELRFAYDDYATGASPFATILANVWGGAGEIINFETSVRISQWSATNAAVSPGSQNAYGFVRFEAGGANAVTNTAAWSTFNNASFAASSFGGVASPSTTGCGATNNIGFCVTSLPPGDYEVEFVGNMFSDYALGSTQCHWSILDSTGQRRGGGRTYATSGTIDEAISSVKGVFTYSGVQTNISFALQATITTGSGACISQTNATGNQELKSAFIIKPLRNFSVNPIFIQSPVRAAQSSTPALCSPLEIGCEIRQYTSTTDAIATGQYADLASVTVPLGVWDLTGIVQYILNAAVMQAGSAFIGTVPGNNLTGLVGGDNAGDSLPATGFYSPIVTISNYRVYPTVTTTYYLKSAISYTSGTPRHRGRLSAVAAPNR